MPNMTVEQWNEQDRQWPRELRIAHAKYQEQVATTEEGRRFWRAVQRANRW